MLSKSWNGMLESVMTGKTAAQLLGFGSSFDLMARSPENVALFNAAMADLTRLVTPDILRAYDFSRVSHLMDVGGGSGELLGAIARQHPRIRGTVFDLVRCAGIASKHLHHIGVSDRVEFVAGDFFEAVPAVADTIILKSVIHDWDDARSIAILRNCRQALPQGGTLLLVERIMPESPTTADEDRAHALSDLNMLRGPGGLERTKDEYRRTAQRKRLRPDIDLSGRPFQRPGSTRWLRSLRRRTPGPSDRYSGIRPFPPSNPDCAAIPACRRAWAADACRASCSRD